MTATTLPESAYKLAPQSEFTESSSLNEKNLLVVLHGLSVKNQKSVSEFKSFAHQLLEIAPSKYQDAKVLPFEYQVNFWSKENMDEAARRLCTDIGIHCKTHICNHILIVAHSAGMLVARKAIIQATNDKALYDELKRKLIESPNDSVTLSKLHKLQADGVEWITKIDRCVFLSGTNRGFIATSHTTWFDYIRFKALGFFFDALEVWVEVERAGNKYAAIGRDSPWMRDLRLLWLRCFSAEGKLPPYTIMLRGDNDNRLDSSDDSDLYQYGNTIPISIENVPHDSWTNGIFADDKKSLTKTGEEIKNALSLMGPAKPLITRKVGHIVFIVHGIRDFGQWQESLEYEINQAFENSGKKVHIVNVRYGYFTSYQFLISTQRQYSIRSFTDAYVQTLAKFPECPQENIHIVAHSNGTFVAAESIRQHDTIIVNKVLFAGSVLPVSYFRETKDDIKKSIKVLRNHCYNTDVPVGILCGSLRPYLKNTGTGGYFGFDRTNAEYIKNYYFNGTHSTGISHTRHKEIADFLNSEGDSDPAGYCKAPVHTPYSVLFQATLLYVPIAIFIVSFVILLTCSYFGRFNFDSKISTNYTCLSASLMITFVAVAAMFVGQKYRKLFKNIRKVGYSYIAFCGLLIVGVFGGLVFFLAPPPQLVAILLASLLTLGVAWCMMKL